MLNKRRFLLVAILIVLAVLAIATPSFAYTYSGGVSVINTGGTAYAQLPVLFTVNNSYLASNYYILSTALDTRMQSASTALPHMVVTDKTLFCAPIGATSTSNFNYTFGNAALTSFSIIPGYNGYITTTDAPALELGDTFQIDVSGYVDTSAGENKYILYKEDAINICIDNATDGTINSTYQDTINESYYASASSGYISNYTQWSDDWAGANGTDKNTNDIIVGSDMSVANWYKWHRGYVIFDTTLIPDDKDILSATLYLYGEQDASTTDFSVVIQSGQPTYPHDPLVLGDYNKSNYSGDGGSLNTSSFTTSGYNSISLNETGIAWINKTGTTKFCLRGSQDIAHTPAAGQAQYVRFYSQEYDGTSRDPYLVITYKNEYTVEAIDIDSGEHVIRISADATDFKLFVDDMDTPEDTISIIGSAVEDNANNWLIDQANVMPYMDYFKLAVGGVEKVWYQPVTIISGTTLPDRDGADENGAITFGSNPVGVTATIGSLTSEGYVIPVSSETTPEDILPTIGSGIWGVSEPTNFITDFFNLLEPSTNLDSKVMWILLAFLATITVSAGAYKLFQDEKALLIGAGVSVGLFVAWGVLPWYMLGLVVLDAVCLVIMWKAG